MHAIDLQQHGLVGAVATYLVLDREPALIDPGPASTLPLLREELARLGLGPGDLRHVLVTHVHPDHAGAEGELATANPALRVHVHRDGAPHLADPGRPVAGTRRAVGDGPDSRLGAPRPVPRDQVVIWEPRTRLPAGLRPLRALATPGHVAHHIAFLHEGDGTLFAGDAMGIVLAADGPTYPVAPGPGVDLDAWRQTLIELRAVGAERAAVAHFGFHADVEARTHRLQEELDRLESRVRRALEKGRVEEGVRAFDAESRERLAEALPRAWVDRYFDVFQASNDWRGVQRWVEQGRRPEGES